MKQILCKFGIHNYEDIPPYYKAPKTKWVEGYWLYYKRKCKRCGKVDYEMFPVPYYFWKEHKEET